MKHKIDKAYKKWFEKNKWNFWYLGSMSQEDIEKLIEGAFENGWKSGVGEVMKHVKKKKEKKKEKEN